MNPENPENIVLVGRNRYQFHDIERARAAGKWVAEKGNLANPVEFAAEFGSDCELLPGWLGISTFR